MASPRRTPPRDPELILRPDLRDRVLERLGFSRPPSVDLAGVRALYGAWCASVPFDNVRKMTALLAGSPPPLPGIHADDFLGNWLAHGAGGTCWPSSNALVELLRSTGFDVERITASMRDLGVENHASARLRIDGETWLADSSMLTHEPLPLGDEVFIRDDRVSAVEVEPVEGTHLLWWDLPPNPTHLPCRLMNGPVDHATYLAAYERSRERSPFNQRLYARRNRRGGLLLLLGNTRFSKTPGGLEARELARDEVIRSLHDEIGISETLIGEWIRAGGLEASFEPPQGPKPPPITVMPPSKR